MRCLFEGGIYLNVVHNKECFFYYGIIIFRIKLTELMCLILIISGLLRLFTFLSQKRHLIGAALIRVNTVVNLHCILCVKFFVQKCKSGIFHDQERHPGRLCNFLFLFCSL